MDFYFIDFFLLIVFILTIGIIFSRMRSAQSANPNPVVTATDNSKAVEDIRSTQTSRAVDAVAVLDELGEASKGYRHYCEIVGTSMPSGGITAPYSKREVAYYDLRCYRIENQAGRDVETLVAHEKSIDPFWFNDGSSDSPIYVDLATFGNNIILVNSCNRIEGPNSDFTRALNNAAGKSGSGSSWSYAAIGSALQRGSNLLAGYTSGARAVLSNLANAFAGPRLAYAGATVSSTPTRTEVFVPASKLGSNALFARGFGYGGFGGIGSPFGGAGLPGDLDSFLGGAFSGGRITNLGGPKFRPGTTDAGALIGIGLGALLSTLSTTSSSYDSGQIGSGRGQDGFCGYRIIEDVVPLSSPVYCLGEIYRSGNEVHMGKSISDTFTTSYFATKSEAELLSHLK